MVWPMRISVAVTAGGEDAGDIGNAIAQSAANLVTKPIDFLEGKRREDERSFSRRSVDPRLG
jgi:hypothetical protein